MEKPAGGMESKKMTVLKFVCVMDSTPVLLGGQGMNVLPPQLFLDYDELYLKVRFDNGDGKGLRHLDPDQRITATPRALVAEVAKTANSVRAGGISTAQFNEQILKYLRPEIIESPKVQSVALQGASMTLSSRAEGKYLNYQWYRNGRLISGATNEDYTIQDFNKSLHDGKYSLVVSNDIGSVESDFIRVDAGKHRVDLNETVAMDMIWCPPGTFMMGSPTSEADRGVDENQHQVTLSHGFYLGKYEVTQAQYEAVMNGNSAGLSADPSHNDHKGRNRPVDQVSWEDTQLFLSRLNDMEQTAGRLPAGWKYDLPTEAQWEYACRAGTTTVYSWGDDINSSRANYNWDGTYNTGNDFQHTRDVGKYDPNLWGFFDMHGNVHEWVRDWKKWLPSYSQIDPEGPPFSPTDNKVSKGASFYARGKDLRSANRYEHDPKNRRSYDHGFRIAFQKVLPDMANPELVLFGGAAITRHAGQAWADPGVEAHDARDGNLTAKITVAGTVDTNTAGTYTLTYTVADGAGNTDTTTRTVTVTGSHTVDLNATVAMDMIWCPPGTFTMGSPTTEAGREADREDEHNVSLTKGFYLGKYEVTQAQYEAVMTGNTNSLGATPSYWPNNPSRPVEKVSWDDVQVFLVRLNAAEQGAGRLPSGWKYVLPTESQWEYACRAGTSTIYSWGNDINSTRANYNWDGGANDGNDFKQTRDVGMYDPNPWGFFDMHGNVWEWTLDWYQSLYPTGYPVFDPIGPASGSIRVTRGGSWYNDGTGLRSAKRGNYSPSHRGNNLGFRVGFQKQ
jgi:formylglycine-generating enzyme required for sulfatase activity